MAKSGPGYATPLDAMKYGPREEILYVICGQPNQTDTKTDLLATIDVNPNSPTYCKIIHRLYTGRQNDELHHSGWNVCASCHHKKGCGNAPVRDKFILAALESDRIYVVDTGKDPKAPTIHKIIEASEMHAFDCGTPHTIHCLPTGEVMISTLGDKEGNAKGEFVLIDGKTWKIIGTWTKGPVAKFGYDFWYKPYFDVMVASEFAAPKVFKRGFKQAEALDPNLYGRSLNFYSWSERKLLQTVNLGLDGIAPLELRFLHNPKNCQGFAGCATNSSVFRFHMKDNKWLVDKVIDEEPVKVSGWCSDYIKGMILDMLISLDDKYLYFSNWFHGDVKQYDISDPAKPKLTGGLMVSDSKVRVLEGKHFNAQPNPVVIKGKRLHGAPQMLQLSLDGKRLYISSSLFTPWDRQFYPETITTGSFLVKVDIDTINGGMKLDPNFLVDFGDTPDGPLLAHEIRYPGGDCTSDIWLAE